MKVVPLAAYLDRTSCGGSPASAASLVAVALPQPTREEEIEEARRQGQERGREAARREYETDLRGERERFEIRLSDARRSWVAEQGESLTHLIGDGLIGIENAIAGAVARLLEPLLVADARKAVVAGLEDVLEEIIARSEAATIRIEGPDDLLAHLQGRLGHRNTIVYVPGAGCDVTVAVDDTLVETRLAAWAAHLREAMG